MSRSRSDALSPPTLAWLARDVDAIDMIRRRRFSAATT